MNEKLSTRARFGRRAAAAVAVVALAGAGYAGVASAAGAAAGTPPSVGTVQARCDAAIQQRLVTLDSLTARVQGSTHLTSSDQTALLGQIQADQSGLTALEGQINQDTTLAQLRTDCPKIVKDFRIYLVMAPKVHLVVAADAVQDAVTYFQDANTTLQSAIATVQATGKNPSLVASAQAAAADMVSHVSSAQSAASPVPGTLVPLTPQDYNQGTTAITSARTALVGARNDLRTARSDLRSAISDLHQAIA